MEDTINTRIARRLRRLRNERDWSLDELAGRCAVSRATLSRLENGTVSPTTEVLGRLCSAFGMTLSRLVSQAEEDYPALLRHADQVTWVDQASGFRRRSVSPPATALAAEVVDCTLESGAHLRYGAPSIPGLEHHLLLLEGALEVTVEAEHHALEPGDCLRYQSFGRTEFRNRRRQAARYVLVLVGGRP